jgi:FkbM family methyltransferase
MNFVSYIAKARHFRDFQFDFHITNETAKSWYDGSPNQWMPEREWCANHLRTGMTVIDCGAHHGMMSVIFADAVGPTGRVIAYEALPSNAAVAQENARLNNFANILVRPVGIGESNSSAMVHVNFSNTVVAEGPDSGGETIQIVRLDDDLSGTKVDFIKIDVEGHDLHALRGMPKVLRQRPIIDLELHNFIFSDRRGTLGEILAILNPLAYSWELLGGVVDKPVKIERDLEVEQIVAFENPHLFGVPAAG